MPTINLRCTNAPGTEPDPRDLLTIRDPRSAIHFPLGPEKILLAHFNAVVTQDVVGGRHMEMDVG